MVWVPMLLPVAQAQRHALDGVGPLRSEKISVAEIDGRVAAASAHARWDLPQRDVSVMDGFAVRSVDLANARACGNAIVLTVVGESAAGHPSDEPLAAGQVARISTGAVLPPGADAVVAQEDTERDGTTLTIDGEATGDVLPGHFVRPRGKELAEGDPVMSPGTVLGPGDIALLAGCGHAEIEVVRRPRVAILSTGDELVPLGQTPEPGQVVSSNGHVLAALARRAGAQVVELDEVGDDAAATDAALRRGLDADVLVTSGGISVGDHDLVHERLTALGLVTAVRGVALRPGKPTTFGTLGRCRVFALPGNPASSLVSFVLFVHPVLRALGGLTGDPHLPSREVVLTEAVRGARGRTHYVRARARRGDPLRAEPLSAQQSGNLRSIAGAQLLIEVPPDTPTLAAGATARALVLESSAVLGGPRP